jgi:hypothetical protein
VPTRVQRRTSRAAATVQRNKQACARDRDEDAMDGSGAPSIVLARGNLSRPDSEQSSAQKGLHACTVQAHGACSGGGGKQKVSDATRDECQPLGIFVATIIKPGPAVQLHIQTKL